MQQELLRLLDFLEATPDKIAEFAVGLSPAELRIKNSESEFSVVENFCHLRDLELQGYTPRIKRMLAEVEPFLVDFDGARVAAESNYNNETAAAALEAFTTARRENVRVLRNLTEEELSCEGMLEGVGKITLEQLAEKMREHDEGHLEDLRILRQRLEKR